MLSSNHPISLIVGLGNPGAKYENTRHNAGAWLVNKLATEHEQRTRVEHKFFGLIASISVAQRKCYLLLPTTFMNNSGQAIDAMVNFYKIGIENILVAHDEIDIPTGQVRLKFSGGHAGHNGLRDIIKRLGTKNFYRLRIGIDRPKYSDDVVDYVLKPPGTSERRSIDNAINDTLRIMPDIIAGKSQQAMQALHTTQKAKVTDTFATLDNR